MNKLFDILKQPYPYYLPFSRSFKLLIFLSMTIPLFLIVFKPFGLNFWVYEYKYWVLVGMGLPIFLTLVTNFYGVVKLLPKFFNEDTSNPDPEKHFLSRLSVCLCYVDRDQPDERRWIIRLGPASLFFQPPVLITYTYGIKICTFFQCDV